MYQAHQLGKRNPRSSAYGRFWIDVPEGERDFAHSQFRTRRFLPNDNRNDRCVRTVGRIVLRQFLTYAGVAHPSFKGRS